jgi:hypothetical protein
MKRESFLVCPRILSLDQESLIISQLRAMSKKDDLTSFVVGSVHSLLVDIAGFTAALESSTGIPVLNFAFYREARSRLRSHIRYLTRYGMTLSDIEDSLQSESSDVNNTTFRWCQGLQAPKHDRTFRSEMTEKSAVRALFPCHSDSIRLLLSYILSSVGAPNILLMGRLNESSLLCDVSEPQIQRLISVAENNGFFEYEDHYSIKGLVDYGDSLSLELAGLLPSGGMHHINKNVLILRPGLKGPHEILHATLDLDEVGLDNFLLMVSKTYGTLRAPEV